MVTILSTDGSISLHALLSVPACRPLPASAEPEETASLNPVAAAAVGEAVDITAELVTTVLADGDWLSGLVISASAGAEAVTFHNLYETKTFKVLYSSSVAPISTALTTLPSDWSIWMVLNSALHTIVRSPLN